jgi:hypothetical protein
MHINIVWYFTIFYLETKYIEPKIILAYSLFW